MSEPTYRSEAVKELAAVWKTGIADLVKWQQNFAKAYAELCATLRDENQQRIDRVQLKLHSASELVRKLTAARSILDAIAAYQEWATQWQRLIAENDQQLLADSEKLRASWQHFSFNVWLVEETLGEPGAISN
jgi:hypothetical protein